MVRLYFKYSLIFPICKKPSKKDHIGETRRQSGVRDQLEKSIPKRQKPKAMERATLRKLGIQRVKPSVLND